MISFEFEEDPDAWATIVTAFKGHDFHHTYSFHKISSENAEGSPLLLVGRDYDEKTILAWPMLARKIPKTNLSDLSSVYGYPGPLITPQMNGVELIKQALAFLRDQKFVSLFSRLHPLLNGIEIANETDLLPLQSKGEIVAVDLTKEISEIKKSIRALKKGTVRKAARAGVTLHTSDDWRDTDIFLNIYNASMDRIGAKPYYYFSKNYVNAILKSTEFGAKFTFAKLNDLTIAAALLVRTGDIVQYYLSGTDQNYAHLSPISTVLSEEILLAKEAGAKWFVLGGGLGGANDGLMHFKKGFSKTTFKMGAVKAVFDNTNYQTLSRGKAGDFFPLYRAS